LKSDKYHRIKNRSWDGFNFWRVPITPGVRPPENDQVLHSARIVTTRTSYREANKSKEAAGCRRSF
jgi:hypothetical protein